MLGQQKKLYRKSMTKTKKKKKKKKSQKKIKIIYQIGKTYLLYKDSITQYNILIFSHLVGYIFLDVPLDDSQNIM